MTRTGILVTSALALSLSPSVLIAQNTAKPNDPQIADIAYTAGQIDVEAAEQALKKTHNLKSEVSQKKWCAIIPQ